MPFQRTVFIICLLFCSFAIIAAYGYRAFVMIPQLPTTRIESGQQAAFAGDMAGEKPNTITEFSVKPSTQLSDSQLTESAENEQPDSASARPENSEGSAVDRAEFKTALDSDAKRQQLVFDDELIGEWDNWSWDTTVDLEHNNIVGQGETSIAVTFDSAWAAFWLSSYEPIYRDDYDLLRFWIHGGESGGQTARVSLADGSQTLQDQGVEIVPQANQWLLVDIPLAELDAGDEISGVSWQDTSGNQQPPFYIDQVSFVKLAANATTENVATENAAAENANNDSAKNSTNAQISIDIDVDRERHPINPDIYGINYGDESLLSVLDHSIRRWGGNAATRYNWQLDVANRASDWFFENVPEEVPAVASLPRDSTAGRFIAQNQAAGVKTIMTMPMIGWTPKSRDFACGFAVSKYGQQQTIDEWNPDCGDGYTPSGEPIVSDPTDTSVAIDPTFVSNWMAHLVQEFGSAANGGVTHYNLDNEPMLWHHTHRDVHPNPVSYDELYERTVAYAAAIKRADPAAQTLGPALWGWSAYQFSALDLEEGGALFDRNPDRAAHSDMPLIAWYLMQMANYEQVNGVRILDYLDVHYYPQADGVALAPRGSPQTRELRLRSTRALWDDTYVDESWINEPVRLIPRLREWIDTYYPGTKIALTEYNWGALDDINGALAQAEVLGIFGREGVDLATMWAPQDADDPFVFAFQIYRNYDDSGSTFGDTSIHSSSSNSEQLSVYSAQRNADGALTVLVINKSDNDIVGTVNLANFQSTALVQRYRYSAEDTSAIQALPTIQLVEQKLVEQFPDNSFTLLVIPRES